MAFAVIFRNRAQADIRSQSAWLERHRGASAAEEWEARLASRVVAALESDPGRYPQAEEAADLGVDLREMLHGRRGSVFRVLFTIDGDTVNVHRIRHAAQDRLAPGDV